MTPLSTTHPDGPLRGLTVVDLTQIVSGAVATMLLADLGARVIKVEPPGGEPYRQAGQVAHGPGGDETSVNILRFSRGKQSVVIDLKHPGGRDALARLIEGADVLVENFRPGVLDRLGFPPEKLEQLNPSLVYASVSGFGHDDLYPCPFGDRPAYALVVEAMAGLTHLAGEVDGPPLWMGFAMGDTFAGVLAFAGIVLALRERDRTGEGGRVDIAMYDGATFMNDLAITTYAALGESLGRGEYAHQSPWGPFETSDGYVVVAVLSESQWQALCETIGRPELGNDPRLRKGVGRVTHHHTVVAPAIAAWAAEQTTADAARILLEAGVPSAPVNTAADLVSCPQIAAREMLIDVHDPVLGNLKLVGNPIKTSYTPALRARVIPTLGEHTDTVLRDFGFDIDTIERLRNDGALGDRSAARGATGQGP
jgi:CoA:oxalate CoA-transferase